MIKAPTNILDVNPGLSSADHVLALRARKAIAATYVSLLKIEDTTAKVRNFRGLGASTTYKQVLSAARTGVEFEFSPNTKTRMGVVAYVNE